MATMGQTGTIKITQEMMDNALRAIDDYQSAITSINLELSGVMTTLLTPSTFSGNAADGLQEFYTNSIEKNVGENLTKMLQSLSNICTTIKQQIPGDQEGVDDQLGAGNRGAGQRQE